MIETKHTRRGVEVFIPYDYFESSLFLSAPYDLKIIHKGKMLKHMASELKDISQGSPLSIAIDTISKDVIKSKQDFLE